jgi:hypothetical protein
MVKFIAARAREPFLKMLPVLEKQPKPVTSMQVNK